MPIQGKRFHDRVGERDGHHHHWLWARGAVAANLLGSYGVRTLVLERDAEPHGMSRAISCDDESMRLFQRLGLADELRRDMQAGEEIRFTNGEGKTFADIQVGKVDFGMVVRAGRDRGAFHRPDSGRASPRPTFLPTFRSRSRMPAY